MRTARIGAVLLLLALTSCSGDDEGFRGSDGQVLEAMDVPVLDLQDGDCLNPPPDLEGEESALPVVPCDEPHLQEVFAIVRHPEGPFPGVGAVSLWADGACLGELESRYDLTLDDGVAVSYLLPTFIGWNSEREDRDVVCVLVFPGLEAAVGSVVAGTAEITPLVPVDPIRVGSPGEAG